MRTAVYCIDRICKGVYRFCVRVCILDGRLNANAFDVFFNMHNRMKSLAVAIQVAHKRSDTAFKVEGHFTVSAFILEPNRHAARNERHFTKALNERVETKINIFYEDLFIKFKGLFSPCFVLHLSNLFNASLGHAALVFLPPNLTITFDLCNHPLRESIYGTDPNTMQTAGDLVAAAAEFTACADHGHDHVQSLHRLPVGALFGG